MIGATSTVDVARGITLTFACMAMALFPGAVIHRIPGWRAFIVACTVTLLFVGAIAANIARWGQPIRWFGTPITLIASLCALIYVISIRGGQFWRDK